MLFIPVSAGGENVPVKVNAVQQDLQIPSQVSILSNRMRMRAIIYTSKLRMLDLFHVLAHLTLRALYK